MNSTNRCIGIFDSGVGGLALARALQVASPATGLLYFDDGRHSPYGVKPREFILKRARTITRHLLAQGASAILLACNTATTQVIASLRREFAVPFFGIEPAVKTAAKLTRNGRVAIAATQATLLSERFLSLCKEFASECEIVSVPCPEWVTLVEKGDIASPVAHKTIEHSLLPALETGVDVVALGCTHFSFLQPLLVKIVPPEVELVDPADRVIAHITRSLDLSTEQGKGQLHLFTSRKRIDDLSTLLGNLELRYDSLTPAVMIE